MGNAELRSGRTLPSGDKAAERGRKAQYWRFEGDDFMFVLSEKEYEILRTQIATSSLTSQNASSNWGGRRYMPFAFTEMGVAMLSSVLRSETAIRVNIAIMRAFVAMRNYNHHNPDNGRISRNPGKTGAIGTS